MVTIKPVKKPWLVVTNLTEYHKQTWLLFKGLKKFLSVAKEEKNWFCYRNTFLVNYCQFEKNKLQFC